MDTKFKTFISGSLVASSLLLSAAPVLAWDWHWPYRDSRDYGDYRYRDYRYSGYRGYRSARRDELYRELDYARRKLAYDRAHHASREQLAHDNRRIENLLRENDAVR